jgi:hypothetical protein
MNISRRDFHLAKHGGIDLLAQLERDLNKQQMQLQQIGTAVISSLTREQQEKIDQATAELQSSLKSQHGVKKNVMRQSLHMIP